jgi:hypothetical protein
MEARHAHVPFVEPLTVPADAADANACASDDREAGAPEVVDFVRFCRGRRRVAWPEIYDEMCAVAARRLYRNWGLTELADHGIRFSLGEMPHLASVVSDVVQEERAGRDDRASERGEARTGRLLAPVTALGR